MMIFQTEIDVIFDKVLKFFGGDVVLAETWFNTPNPMFAGKTPDQMIQSGNANVVSDKIDHSLSLNVEPKE